MYNSTMINPAIQPLNTLSDPATSKPLSPLASTRNDLVGASDVCTLFNLLANRTKKEQLRSSSGHKGDNALGLEKIVGIDETLLLEDCVPAEAERGAEHDEGTNWSKAEESELQAYSRKDSLFIEECFLASAKSQSKDSATFSRQQPFTERLFGDKDPECGIQATDDETLRDVEGTPARLSLLGDMNHA